MDESRFYRPALSYYILSHTDSKEIQIKPGILQSPTLSHATVYESFR